MTEKDAIRNAMTLRKLTQKGLADKAGVYGQAGVSGYLNRNKRGVRFDILCKLFDALDFDIYVVDRYNPEMRYKIESAEPEVKEKPQPRKPRKKSDKPLLHEKAKAENADAVGLDLDAILNTED